MDRILLMVVVLGIALVGQAVCARDVNKELNSLWNQMLAMQTESEEKNLAGVSSGIKQVRVEGGGTSSYHHADYTNNGVASIHNHANNINTCGMGEVVAVLNGVEFRTRHNDYKLVMPHRRLNGLKDYEPIPFPDVPPSVKRLSSITAQVAEMRKYFKAFKEQDPSIAPYNDYFKPVLCYMEGAWMKSSDLVDEPFDSDRHDIDAETWSELLEKVKYYSYTGGKDPGENLAFLPKRISEVLNESVVFEQFNYRIRCAPVNLASDNGLKLNRFRVVDDLAARMSMDEPLGVFQKTRAARYSLGYWPANKKGRELEKKTRVTILDTLMSQIPGYDNYNQFIADNDFNAGTKNFNGSDLNCAYYHRVFQESQIDAMGVSARRRSFADQNVFMACNTQEKIPGARFRGCTDEDEDDKVCYDIRKKMSYAIPLEIVYLTPLLSWNPYNLQHKTGRLARTVIQGGRNGGLSPGKAYNGTANIAYFRTPKEFFLDRTDTDPADTDQDVVGVLNRNGQVKEVRASGTRIFLPSIPDVGEIRLRWPIHPVSKEGSAIQKELDALKNIVLRMSSYSDMLMEMPPGNGDGGDDDSDDDSDGDDSDDDDDGDDGNDDGGMPPMPPTVPTNTDTELHVDQTSRNPPGLHKHKFTLTTEDVQKLFAGGEVTVVTTQNLRHNHTLRLRLTKDKKRLRIFRCDGKVRCWDGHGPIISEATSLIRDYQSNK